MNSWTTIEEADLYFTYRLNSSEWNEATLEVREAALVTAQRQILRVFDSTVEGAERLKEAQCEQSLFLLKFGDGAERRAALQAQGVKSAGIVQETYESKGVAISPETAGILKDYKLEGGGHYSGTLTRNEEE